MPDPRKFGGTHEIVLAGFEIVLDEFGNVIITKTGVPLKEFRDLMDKEFPDYDRIDGLMAVLRDALDEIDDTVKGITERYGVIR